jgi:hypothetical protein
MREFEITFTGTIIVEAESKDEALDEATDTLNSALFSWSLEGVA